MEAYYKFSFKDLMNEATISNLSVNMSSLNSTFNLAELMSPEMDVFSFVVDNFLYIINKLRFLFYLVWPTETLFSSLDQVPRYVAEMFPVFFAAAIAENVVRLLQGRHTVRVNETVGSLSQGIFQECLRIKVRSVEVLMYCLVWDKFRLISLPWDSLWTWWFCYLSVDLGFYWAHRLAHEVNFIWAVHQAHHSSEEFSIVSALRQAVLQPFTAWLSELYMVWLHTEIVDTIGPLEYILNTPSHHRVHHSRNPEYIDKNYGGMLIIWDRLFQTFKAEDKFNRPVYGLVHPVRSFNPIHIQFYTWPVIWRRICKAESFKDKLGVLFYGPGWKPGLPRLGDARDIPKIVHPVVPYDPQLSYWQNIYVVIHFGLLLLFYHELTLYQEEFRPSVLNIGVLSLLFSIISLGLMLDNKRWYSSLFELARCLLFFKARYWVNSTLNHGLERAGIGSTSRIISLSLVHILFGLSVLLITIYTLSKVLSKLSQTSHIDPCTLKRHRKKVEQ